jgi:hypothetical protein
VVRAVRVGGNWNNGSNAGPWYRNANNAPSNANANYGAGHFIHLTGHPSAGRESRPRRWFRIHIVLSGVSFSVVERLKSSDWSGLVGHRASKASTTRGQSRGGLVWEP